MEIFHSCNERRPTIREPDETVSEARTGDDFAAGSGTVRGLVWLGMLAVLAIWVAVGRVSTYRGGGLRGTARVWDVWRLLRHELPLPSSVVLALLFVVLSACAWLVWLALSITTDPVPGAVALRPPGWAIGALVPLAFVVVALLRWDDPRDDVTAEELVNRTGMGRTAIPTACVGFLEQAAVLRSGDLQAGRAERTAEAACQAAIATQWPTETPRWPTQTAVWGTIEAAGR